MLGIFRFHLIGAQPVTVEVAARTILELGQIITTERFIIGTRVEPDEDGVLPGMLMATSRIQCVLESN